MQFLAPFGRLGSSLLLRSRQQAPGGVRSLAEDSNVWEIKSEDAESLGDEAGAGRHGRAARPRRAGFAGRHGNQAADKGDARHSGGFRVLVVPGLTKEAETKRPRRSHHRLAPRCGRMRPSQDWTAVWPSARSFHPGAVPLPLRQGMTNNATENAGISPNKFGNTELIKIPNFLHLTPAHVRRHCRAIRHLCTEWPAELTDSAIDASLPLRVITTDYVRAGCSLRDPRARRVDVRLPLASLTRLDRRSAEKLVCLVRLSRFAEVDEAAGQLRMWSERCPWRGQNYDYLQYALAALYGQSLKAEKWEADKQRQDNLRYEFAGSSSERWVSDLPPEAAKAAAGAVGDYESAVTELFVGDESEDSLRRYGDSVRRLLQLPPAAAAAAAASKANA